MISLISTFHIRSILVFSTIIIFFLTIYTSNKEVKYHQTNVIPILKTEKNNAIQPTTPTAKAPYSETKVIYPETVPTIQDLFDRYESSNLIDEAKDESAYLKICPNFGKDIQIVVVITSRPNNAEGRIDIRRTWGSLSSRGDLAIVFNVGYPKNEEIAKKLEKEQKFYGDLVRGKFLDTYDNLTLKTTWMLKWVSKYCSNADYVLKVDDDIYVNIDLLLDFINGKIITSSRTIYGRLVKGWHPVRDPNDKYYISKSIYSPNTYPEFTTGGGYIFPSRLADELYHEALKLPYMKLEDVFYNGIVASRLNISRVDIAQFVNLYVDLDDCTIKEIITVHGVEREFLYYVWYKANTVDMTKCA